MRRSLRALIPAAVAVVVLVVVVANSQPRGHYPPGSGGNGPYPIGGWPTTLEKAKPYPHFTAPVLRNVSVKDPCTGKQRPVQILNVFAGKTGRVVGLQLTSGLVIDLKPTRDWAETVSGNELRPPQDVFKGNDSMPQIHEARVRGHIAWVSDNHLRDVCADDESPSPVPSDWKLDSHRYHHHPLNVVSWLENGWILEVLGPYPKDELMRLVLQGFTFE